MEKEIVLYIDDDETNLTLFTAIFENDYQVLTTSDTTEARQMMGNNEIKVAIVDLFMPQESGTDFIEDVSKSYPDVFYIILTSHYDLDAALNAINKGNTYRYLLKPWDTNEMRASINSAIFSYNLSIENKRLFNELKDKNTLLEKALTQLKERETQFLKIFEASNDAIIIYNANKEILMANPVFYNFVQAKKGTRLKITDLLSDKLLEIFEQRFQEIFTNPTPIFEYQLPAPNGEIRFIEANSTTINYYGEKVVLSILRDITERKLMAQRILNEVVQAEDRERKRLATDLHDGLGPTLSTLNMYIEWLADKTRKEDSEEILRLSRQTIKEAITQLRSISYNLSPHLLEKFGLNAAVQSLIDTMNEKGEINFRFQSNLCERLPHNCESALFWVIKECINNTQKHSKAKESFISLYLKNDLLYFDYADNGVGFDYDTVKKNSMGMGLYNIQNRIQSLGGNSEIKTETGKGIKIKATIKIS
ncbi:MAG TPA: response regulator [Bacteroidales bacterium]|mgnify:CR=1 FL=1|nr:response regulator [Bacteroidales bacterium]